MKLLIMLFYALFLPNCLLAQEQIYSFNDLKALSIENNYSEYFDHALDITPSKRNLAWKTMTEQMGQDFLTALIELKEIESKNFGTVRKISNWPIFKNNEFFIIKRDQILLRELKSCKSITSTKCKKLLNSSFYDFKHSPEFPFEFIKVISKTNQDNTFLWDFIKDFVKLEISQFYCAKEPLKSIVLNKTYHYIKTTKKYDLPLHKLCTEALFPTISMDLASNDKEIRSAAYKILKKNNKLDIIKRSSFKIRQFLAQTNHKNKEVDEYLSILKKLGKDYAHRENVLQELKKLDPIPDNIYSDTHNKTIVKTKILNRYFPEFLDYYIHSCLDYLKGLKKFPKGNPTPKCHQFMKTYRSKNIIPASLVKQYDKATYFFK